MGNFPVTFVLLVPYLFNQFRHFLAHQKVRLFGGKNFLLQPFASFLMLPSAFVFYCTVAYLLPPPPRAVCPIVLL